MGKAVNFIAGVVLIVVGVIADNPQLIWTGLAMLAGAAAAALQKKPHLGRGLGLDVNFAGTIEPRRILYGTLKVGGMHNIPPLTSGTEGEMGHADIVVAGHEVADITDVSLDNDLISSADIGTVAASPGADTDGQVLVGKFANHVWIRRYLGLGAAQFADFILTHAFPAAITTNFRLRGNAHIAVRCKFNASIFTNWPNITAIVKGAMVYDPRLDVSPGASPTNPAYIAHTACPPLLIRHFLINEVGFSEEEINYTLLVTAANTCDVAVAIPGSTQKRWTCNTLLVATDPWEENLRVMVESMEGHVVYIDGVWLIYAGEWQTPDVTINQGDWVSPMQVRASANRDERWNFVRGWYVDPDRNWQRMECYPRRSTTYETADGNERIPVEIEMGYCASSVGTKHAEYEAQRHAEIQLRKSRNQLQVSGKLRPEFAKLIPGNTVNVNDSTYGWVTKTFRVAAVESGLGAEGGADVALIEEASTLWTDLVAGDYNTESASSVLNPGFTTPTLTADPIVIVGPNLISFNWNAAVPTTQPAATEYAVIENANSNYPPTSGYGFEVWRGLDKTAIVARADANTRNYWIIANVGTYKSAYRPSSAGIPVAPMSYGPSVLTFTQQPTSITTKHAGDVTQAGAKWAPNVTHTPNTPYATWIGNNGTVTASWQVMSSWYTGANTPATILASTVTNNGSYVPAFKMVNTVMGYDQTHATLFKLTIKDTSTTLNSNNFTATWVSGTDLN